MSWKAAGFDCVHPEYIKQLGKKMIFSLIFLHEDISGTVDFRIKVQKVKLKVL